MYSTQLLDMSQTAVTPYNQSTNTLFSPTYISGCSLWLDATDSSTISTTGNTVTQWRDKSGKGFNAVPSGGAYSNPVVNNVKWNGLQVVSFVDIQAEMQIPNFVIPTQSRTLLFVYQVPGSYGANGNVGLLTRFGATAQSVSIGIFGIAIGTSSVANRVITNNGWNTTNILLICIVNSSTSSANNIITINGVSQTLATSSAAASYETTPQTYQLGIGYNRNPPYYGIPFNLGEVMEYAAELSTSERQQVEGYLAWKWGLQRSLPTTHPYYNNAYLPNSYPIPYFPSRINPTSVVPTVPGFTIPRTIRQYIFNPTSISGAALWLDAADANTVITTGSTVTRWNDKSGNGYNAVSNANYGTTTLPTYITNSYVQMANTQALCTALYNYTTSWSVFVCMNTVSLAARWLISPYVSVNNAMMGMVQGTNKILFANFPSVTDITGNHIEYTSAENTAAASNLVYYRDTVIQASNVTNLGVGANATAKMGIGANATAANVMGGTYQIYEIIIYNTYLNTSQRQQVEGYLAWKWGLQSNLPANHPFKLFPP